MARPGGSGKVNYGSDLERRKWLLQGLVQTSHKSVFAPYKGTTADSIIYQERDISAKEGHTVVFDYDGFLKGKAIRGSNTAKGKGEQKVKFSDKLTVTDWRWVVDNGTKFDGVNIGDLSINEHSDSRTKLGNLFVRNSDQAIFDVAQQSVDHIIDITTFNLDSLLEIEEVMKEGTGFSISPAGINQRMPLLPVETKGNDEPVWLFVVDTAMKNMFLKSPGAQALLAQADLRGDGNRLFKGVIGRIGNFLIVEGSRFFGTTTGPILDTLGYYNFDNTSVEISGLRQYDKTNDVWTGQEGFDKASDIYSRGIILGKNAIQFAIGKSPDYKVEATDFGKFTESCMEFWGAVKATELYAENEDYKKAKIAGYKFGLVGVDIKIA